MKNIVLLIAGLLATSVSFGQTEIDIPENQMSLITKRTATWCPFCGEWGWELKEGLLQDNQTNALFISAHFSGDLQTAVAVDLTNNFGGFGQPRFYLGNEDQRANSGNVDNIRSEIKNKVATSASSSPLAQSGILATFDRENLLVVTRTRFFQQGDGDYYLGIYLIEKERMHSQAGRSGEPVHRNRILANLNGDSFGEPIAMGGIPANNEIEWATGISLADIPDLSNLMVATIIWKKENDNYFFVNTNYTDQFQEINLTNTAFLTPDKLADFKVYPTVVANRVTIEFSLDQHYSETAVELYDMNGRMLHQVHGGELLRGEHRFEVPMTADLPAGLYQMRVRLNDKIAAKPLVIR